MSSADLRYKPDHAVLPGATLRARLAEIDLSQAELAVRAGLSAKHVNQILQGQAPITLETAVVLERVTGTPAKIWNALEANYREALMRERTYELSPEDKRWMDSLPVAALKKLGRLPKAASGGELFEALLSFFGVADREAWERVWLQPVASFRRTKAFKSDGAVVAAWLRLGELEARGIRTSPFNPVNFRSVLDRCRALTLQNAFSEKLATLCASAGVVVVFVPEIGGERASGASRWLSPSRALIQLTDRNKRDDHFWFAFFHECGHLLLHSKKQTFIHDGSEAPDLETEADKFAADLLIPRAASAKLAQLLDNAAVLQFATEISIAPGIVVGRLQHDGLWPWNRGNDLKRSLHIAAPGA